MPYTGTQPEPPSILDLASASPWAIPIIIGKPTLVSWRTTLALLIREAAIEPVAKQLWPTLQSMAAQVINAAMNEAADCKTVGYHISYFKWLDWWRAQFDHWHDPIRALVAQHCIAGDAAHTVQHFPMFDGFAFCDFVMTAVEAHGERCAWRARLFDQLTPDPFLPLMVFSTQPKPAMERVCLQLYRDFQQKVPFVTGPAPLDYDLTPLVSEIYAYKNDASDVAEVINWKAEQ